MNTSETMLMKTYILSAVGLDDIARASPAPAARVASVRAEDEGAVDNEVDEVDNNGYVLF